MQALARTPWERTLFASIAIACASAPSLASADAETAGPIQPAPEKHGPEFVGSLGGAAGSSSWRGDPLGLAQLKLGFRFGDWIAPVFLSRLGYASVNSRSILTLTLGLQAWARVGPTRPYLRAAVIHQHEESLMAIKDDVAGALFGVGDGISHRSGPELGLGIDVPIHRQKRTELVVTAESSTLYFPDPRGPSVYVLGTLALGLNYSL